ncbi:hypothetical protein TSUD_02240 [Trifolium subterraneum]|nr:hypothetical protein TSUD_02240 [Trifolium subterraneum]
MNSLSSSTPLHNSTCFIIILIIVVSCKLTNAIVKLPPNVTVPAVLVFGDSIVDTGNNNNNLRTTARCNFPPYGKDFKGGIPTGRFSNGKVPSDLLVEELGIKELLPAYLDPNLQPSDLLTGVCFASGGAGYDPLTSQTSSTISLSGQLDLFKEYIEKLRVLVGEEKTNFILTNSLVLVVFGSNDISNTYFLSRIRQVQYDFPSYADFMVNSASNFLERTAAGGIERKIVVEYNEAVELYNNKLSKGLASFNQYYPNSRIVYIDVYNPLLDIIVNSDKYA